MSCDTGESTKPPGDAANVTPSGSAKSPARRGVAESRRERRTGVRLSWNAWPASKSDAEELEDYDGEFGVEEDDEPAAEEVMESPVKGGRPPVPVC